MEKQWDTVNVMKPMHGAAYYPETWDEKEQEHDIEYMKKAGMNVMRIAEFAWGNMEPKEGKFECEDLTVVLNEGTGVFFKAHSPHKYYRTSKEFKTAWFTFYGLDGLLKYYNINNAFKFDVPEFLTFPYFSFEELAGSDSTAISRSAKTHCLVADIFSSHFSSKTTLSTLIDQYLENHFGEMISLDSLALQFNMTKFALCRKYNKESGRTIIEQLQKIRIAKAKRYLSSTSLSVEEIGKMCGFDSPSYFCKTFKKRLDLALKLCYSVCTSMGGYFFALIFWDAKARGEGGLSNFRQ